jgi:hypothetical protein
MQLSVLVPVEYRGELVALVSRERIHIVSPWLRERPVGDPDLRFVAYMCMCCGEVLNGRLSGPFSNELAEQWARLALIDPAALTALSAMPDAEASRALNVPVGQLSVARRANGVRQRTN